LTAIGTAYPIPPCLPIFHPTNPGWPARDPVAVWTSIGWIDFSAVRFGTHGISASPKFLIASFTLQGGV
jgi:hypothetical protein